MEVRVLSPGLSTSDSEADGDSAVSSAEMSNEWSPTHTPPIRPSSSTRTLFAFLGFKVSVVNDTIQNYKILKISLIAIHVVSDWKKAQTDVKITKQA